MKTLGALVSSSLHSRQQRTNLRVLVNLLLLLTAIVFVYTVAFHLIMAHEGQDHSWLSGSYWTMVTMSTLGYGDLSFHSDLGRMFAVLVVMSGTVFMLILLPFFYAPWLESRNAARAPRKLPPDTRDHVLLTQYGPIDAALIRRLDKFGTPYAVIVLDIAEALALHDQGITVMVGDLDDPDTYRAARADHAAMVATASAHASVDNLELAGCQQVLQLGNLLGRFLARRGSVSGGHPARRPDAAGGAPS